MSTDLIDADGFRSNVAMVVVNSASEVLWMRRADHIGNSQFPQGGVHRGESETDAMYRELEEEVGLRPTDVRLLQKSKGWLHYRLPDAYRASSGARFVGQKQRWFLLHLLSEESAIDLNRSMHPEFDAWRWVTYWHPVAAIIEFKRDVYRRALAEFAPLLTTGDY